MGYIYIYVGIYIYIYVVPPQKRNTHNLIIHMYTNDILCMFIFGFWDSEQIEIFGKYDSFMSQV